MSNVKTQLNITALVCACAMIISCFLPWTEFRASASLMGYNSSYQQSATGIQTGMAIFPLILGVICLVVVMMKVKWAFIPGIINILIAISSLTGIGNFTANYSSGFGEASYKTGIGIYALLFSCIGYLLFTTILGKKNTEIVPKQINTEQEISNSEIKEDINRVKEFKRVEHEITEPIISGEELRSSTLQSFNQTPKKITAFQKVIGIIGILIVIYCLIFTWANNASEKQKREKEIVENNEKQRIDQIIDKINEAVTNQNLDVALTNVNLVSWNLNNDSDYKSQYDQQRNNLKITIEKLKHERDSLENVQNIVAYEIAEAKDSAWKADQEVYPYVVSIVAEKTYSYKEPDINSDRENSLNMHDFASVLSKQNEFLFCKFTQNGVQNSGWILYKDVEKY